MIAILDVYFIVSCQKVKGKKVKRFAMLGDFLFVEKMKQRICIKFCFKNGIKYSTVLEMSNIVFGEFSMNKTSVYKYKRFQEGREDVEDDERPSTSTIDDNIEKIKKMIIDNRRITIREIADVGISFGSCQAIFSNVLGMKRVAAKFVPKLLNILTKNCAKRTLLRSC